MASRGVRGTAEVREVGIDSECSLEEGECSSTPVLGKNRKAPAQEEEERMGCTRFDTMLVWTAGRVKLRTWPRKTKATRQAVGGICVCVCVYVGV